MADLAKERIIWRDHEFLKRIREFKENSLWRFTIKCSEDFHIKAELRRVISRNSY